MIGDDPLFTLDIADDTQPDYDWNALINEKPALEPVYRIEERDKRNGPKCTLAEGTIISFSRVVARVGYEFGAHSITKTEWWEAGLEIAAKKTGVQADDIKKLIVALRLGAPFKFLGREIYDAKIRPLTHKSTMRNVRAMWFYDYPKPRRGRIDGRVTKLTGYRDPGHQDSDGEWEPPTLAESKSQKLYKVWDVDYFDFDAGPNPVGTRYKVLVYPEDVL